MLSEATSAARQGRKLVPPDSPPAGSVTDPSALATEHRIARLLTSAARNTPAVRTDGSRPEAAPVVVSVKDREGLQQEQVASSSSSSQRRSASPKWRVRARVSSSSSPRIIQSGIIVEEGQRSKKRKSPGTTMPLFRSPLSKMLLSPRMESPRAWLRSPAARHGTSPSTAICRGQRARYNIDLNVQPEGYAPEVDENVEPEGYAPEGDENVEPEGYAPEGDENVEPHNNARKNVVVTDDKRRAIFEALLARAKNGDVTGDEKKEVSVQFSVHIRTVQRIWKKGKSFLDQGHLVDVKSARFKCGRKKMNLDVSTLQDIPMSSRGTIADVAMHFGVSKTKVHSMKREGVIKRVSNTIKPYLTDKNKKDRLKWCMSMLDPMSLPQEPMFKGFFDHVIIDEKWFYITRKTQRYYSVPGLVEPTRTCKNKNYIPKIQILTAVGRPRFDSDGNCTFDGKIGCWAFVTYEPAKRSSVNRPAGTIEMKSIESITKDVMRAFMIEKVLPAIRAKWPREDIDKPIYIQQDNAKPHVAPNDRLFCEAAKQDRFDIKLVCQPANSPDLNVLDLGFFNSLQSIQHKKSAKTTEELVAAVDTAFTEYSVCQSNRIFLTLHGCMEEVMRIGGGNGYDIPHIRKGMLERQGLLPLQLKCDPSLVQQVMVQISE